MQVYIVTIQTHWIGEIVLSRAVMANNEKEAADLIRNSSMFRQNENTRIISVKKDEKNYPHIIP